MMGTFDWPQPPPVPVGETSPPAPVLLPVPKLPPDEAPAPPLPLTILPPNPVRCRRRRSSRRSACRG